MSHGVCLHCDQSRATSDWSIVHICGGHGDVEGPVRTPGEQRVDLVAWRYRLVHRLPPEGAKQGAKGRIVEELRLSWFEPLDEAGSRWAHASRSVLGTDAAPGTLAWSVLAPDPSLVATGRRAWAFYLSTHPDKEPGRMFAQQAEVPTEQALAFAGLIARHLAAVREALVREKGLALPENWALEQVPGDAFWCGATLDSLRRAVDAATGKPLRPRRRPHLAGPARQRALRVKPTRMPPVKPNPHKLPAALPFEALLVRPERHRQAVRELGEHFPEELGLPIRLDPVRLDREERRAEEAERAVTMEQGEVAFDGLLGLVWLSAVHGVEYRTLARCANRRCGALFVRTEAQRTGRLCPKCAHAEEADANRRFRLRVRDDALKAELRRAQTWVATVWKRWLTRYAQDTGLPLANVVALADTSAEALAQLERMGEFEMADAIRSLRQARRWKLRAEQWIRRAAEEGWDPRTFRRRFDREFGRREGRGRPPKTSP